VWGTLFVNIFSIAFHQSFSLLAGPKESKPKPKALPVPIPALSVVKNMSGSSTTRIPSNCTGTNFIL